MEQNLSRSASPGAYELPIGRSAWPKVVGTVLTGALFVVGLVVARYTIDPGIDDFQNDPVAHAMAKEAYGLAWIHRDNPIQRLLAPAAKVVFVERRPGRCKYPEDTSSMAPSRMTPPDPGVPLRADPGAPADASLAELGEYVASVRFYTSFGIPVATVNIHCGGSGASYEPLP